MAVYYDNTSLKAKHERKRSLEEPVSYTHLTLPTTSRV